ACSEHVSVSLLLTCCDSFMMFFFFQAEDGIRDRNVTGVQTCALPILFLSMASSGAFRSHSVDEPESVFNEPTLLPSSMIEMSRYSPCLLLTATTQKLSRNDFGTKAASAIE